MRSSFSVRSRSSVRRVSVPFRRVVGLASARPGCFLVAVAVVGVRLVLPWVAVGGCCCGFLLVLVLPSGLACLGLRSGRWVLLAAGGLVFLLRLLPCSCRCFSFSLGGFVPFLSQRRSLYDKLLANPQLLQL